MEFDQLQDQNLKESQRAYEALSIMSENAEKISAAESHERANSSSNVEECEESIDTVHNDEALKIIMRYSGPQSWTAEEEKHLVRRIDRRLMTILCVTFGLQYYDKQMLSQAVSSYECQRVAVLTRFDRLCLDLSPTLNYKLARDIPCRHQSFTLDSSPDAIQRCSWPKDTQSNESSLLSFSYGDYV